MSDLLHRLEFRVAATLEVRHPERIIELLAVPYNTPTGVMVAGRMIEETIAPGAFTGVERRANRVKVNLGHDEERTVGRAVALYPDRPDGLVAELKIGRGPDRDQVLDDAADGILDASIGFAPFIDGEEWLDNRSRRRVTRAFLGHIALVPNPAYEGATVLSVRHTPPTGERPATPNLDMVRAWRLEEMYGSVR